MGLDRLGILFIIIILPISIFLNAYIQGQIDTLDLQISYDKKLNNATYDAVKTFQLNSLNEDASSLGNVRLDSIGASVSTFYNSLSANLNMSGYNREFLQQYVPAIVFTMYDGYYIYSKYTNTLGKEDYKTADKLEEGSGKYPSTYQDGQSLYGLKPFIHYSCRYKIEPNDDFVVTYSLDNYITIQGIINGYSVNDAGYVVDISPSTGTRIYPDGSVYYRGQEIKEEDILTDNLIVEPDSGAPVTESYKYHKVNGVKYYWDENEQKWFSMLNGTKLYTLYTFDEFDESGNKTLDGTLYDNSAKKYYKEAIEFTERLRDEYKLVDILAFGNIADEEVYTVIDSEGNEVEKGISRDPGLIFELKGIEEPTSNFNKHRQDVIRYCIEKNLSIAIANYNDYGGVSANFQMPEFSEVEWDKIQSNICVISYLQGLPIGNKLYNGVSVIANNLNEEVIAENSIKIVNGPNGKYGETTGYNYYPITKAKWNPFPTGYPIGVSNVDLERRQVTYNNRTYYYYPKLYYDVYGDEKDTVNLNAEETDSNNGQYAYNGNIYKYLDELSKTNTDVVSAYYTALGRERYSMYKQRNNYQEMLTENEITD